MDTPEFRGESATASVSLVPAKHRIGLGIVVEYLMFASAIFLALILLATRVPLRMVDTTFGLRLRERFVDFLARVSPG